MATHQAFIDRLLQTQQEKGYKTIWLYYKLRDKFPVESADPFTVDDLDALQVASKFDGGKVGQAMRAAATAELSLELDDRFYLWNHVSTALADDPDLTDAVASAYPVNVLLNFEPSIITIPVMITATYNLPWIQEELTTRLHEALLALYSLSAVPIVLFEVAPLDAIAPWIAAFKQWEEWTLLERVLQMPEVAPTRPSPVLKPALQQQLSFF